MPNRILKENVRTSCKLNAVSDGAYRLWSYLLTYVDDYGRGSADVDVLKGFVFPKQHDRTADDVAVLLDELTQAALVCVYAVDGEPYLCFPDWELHQNVRNRRSKYPAPMTEAADAQAARTDNAQPVRTPDAQPQSDKAQAQPDKTQTQFDKAQPQSDKVQAQSDKAETARTGGTQAAQEEHVAETFNTICTALPHIAALTQKRRRAIRAVSEQVASFGGWERLFRAVQESDFLTGRSGQWNGCGFDWVLVPQNLQKIIEGNYRNRAPTAPPSSYDVDEIERRLLHGPIRYKAHA